MSAISSACSVCCRLPFAGYWLMREIYQYNQQMGITLMGGFLSWLFIMQAMLIGVLFLGFELLFLAGDYLSHSWIEWQNIGSRCCAMLIILLLCLGVWMTPHSLVASMEEAQKMGGTHHPLLGVLGVMSAKMTVANLMILITFMSFIMYWRAGKQDTAGWAKLAKVGHGRGARAGQARGDRARRLGVLRSRHHPHQLFLHVAGTDRHLFVILTITPLTALLLKSAKTTTEMVWGRMPPRAGYALVLNAVMVILLMTLMGYARSSSRVHWHVYGVMRDTSHYAFSPALG